MSDMENTKILQHSFFASFSNNGTCNKISFFVALEVGSSDMVLVFYTSHPKSLAVQLVSPL